MKMWFLGALAFSTFLAACSNRVEITPDTTGSGQGAAYPGDAGGSTGTGGPGKVLTADTDMAQYRSIKVDLLSTQPVVQGPFFVTDVIADNTVTFFTVTGTDCATPQAKVLLPPASGPVHVHGIRLPILAGQSLCQTGSVGTLNVLGFKPY